MNAFRLRLDKSKNIIKDKKIGNILIREQILKDFPPKVPIFWNTNVKCTNITPKFCHIFLLTLTLPTP